jgi:hypothetical protein
MTREDRQILFTAVAYAVVFSATVHTLVKQEIEPEANTTYRLSLVPKIARQIEEFCKEDIPTSFSDEMKDAEIDAAIEKHIRELREIGSTILPQNFDSLMQIYVRLQFRKVHRINAALFDRVDAAQMAKFVLSQLDEEIEYLDGVS